MSLNRRDLMKLGGAAFVASLIPDQLIKVLGAKDIQSALMRLQDWDLPAYAASNADYNLSGNAMTLPGGKLIWNGQLNTGMPDLYSTHKMPKIPQMARLTYGGAVVAEWPDATTVPNQAWYALFAAAFLADTNAVNQCPQGWFLFDLESFDVTSSQAARLTAADNFVTIYNGIKAVLPNFKFGFYAYPNLNDWANASLPYGAANYLTWQGKHEDFAALYASNIETVFPKLYMPYTRSANSPQTVSGVRDYVSHQIHDTYRMIRKYGHGQKVYPVINYTKGADGVNPIDFDVFEMITRLCYQLADGFVCWGGFATAWATESARPWWANVVEPMALGRKPGPLMY